MAAANVRLLLQVTVEKVAEFRVVHQWVVMAQVVLLSLVDIFLPISVLLERAVAVAFHLLVLFLNKSFLTNIIIRYQ